MCGTSFPRGHHKTSSQPQVAGALGSRQPELGRNSWDSSIFLEPPPAAAKGQSLWNLEDWVGGPITQYNSQQPRVDTEYLQCGTCHQGTKLFILFHSICSLQLLENFLGIFLGSKESGAGVMQTKLRTFFQLKNLLNSKYRSRISKENLTSELRYVYG